MKIVISLGILFLALSLFLSYWMKEDKLRSAILFPAFPVAQLIVWLCSFLLIRNYAAGSYTLFLVGSLLLCLVADAALLIAIRRTESNAAVRAKNRQMEELLELREQHYATLCEKQEDMRKMQVDIERTLSRVRTLLTEGETASAVAELDGLKQMQSRQPGYVPGSSVAEIFVEQRRRELERKGIVLHSAVELLPMEGISDVDVICAVGNMLDNAEEACTGMTGAEIDLSLCPKGDYLCIRCENPITLKSKAEKQRRIPELERGLGVSILKELARQKDGNFAITTENGHFCAELMLKTRQPVLAVNFM